PGLESVAAQRNDQPASRVAVGLAILGLSMWEVAWRSIAPLHRGSWPGWASRWASSSCSPSSPSLSREPPSRRARPCPAPMACPVLMDLALMDLALMDLALMDLARMDLALMEMRT